MMSRLQTCSRKRESTTAEQSSTSSLIARLTADNEAQKARVAQLQERVDALTTPQSIFLPTLPAISPTASLMAFPTVPTSPIDVTNAERIVLQLFEGEVDLMTTQQSLLANTAHQLSLPIDHNRARRTTTGTLTMLPNMVNRSFLPDFSMTEKMIDMFFNFTNCFHPVLDRETVAEE